MRTLALDVGTRRTGVAFLDDANGIPLPLDTIVADTKEEMIRRVTIIARERTIDRLIIGLPLLPSGDEGAQVRFVRSCADELAVLGVPIRFVDERYTSINSNDFDGDARAACQLLESDSDTSLIS